MLDQVRRGGHNMPAELTSDSWGVGRVNTRLQHVDEEKIQRKVFAPSIGNVTGL